MLAPHTAAFVAALAAAGSPSTAPAPPTAPIVDARVRAPACPEPEGLMSPGDRKQARNLAIVGGVIFGVFYAGASGFAAAELDATRHAEDTPRIRDRRRIAMLMFVPVVGPWVATPLGASKGDRAGLAGFGILQTFGAAALATSLVTYARHHRARRRRAWMLSGAIGPGQGFVGVRGRF